MNLKAQLIVFVKLNLK